MMGGLYAAGALPTGMLALACIFAVLAIGAAELRADRIGTLCLLAAGGLAGCAFSAVMP